MVVLRPPIRGGAHSPSLHLEPAASYLCHFIPTCVILMTSSQLLGALAIPWTKSNVPAILDAHYPGQQGGTAVWKTLLNLDGAAPAGRITTTIYDADFVNHHDMNNMALDNITYMHYSGKPLWEFGFGLSYSRFNVTWHSSGSSSSVYGVQTVTTTEMAKVHREYYKGRGRSAAKGSVDLWHSPAMFTATVMNTGTVASDYVVLGFSRQRRVTHWVRRVWGACRPAVERDLSAGIEAKAGCSMFERLRSLVIYPFTVSKCGVAALFGLHSVHKTTAV